MKVVPQERLQKRTVEQISEQTADEPVPHIVEEIDEVVKFVPQERVQQHVAGQVVDVLVRQIMDEMIGVMKVVRPESVCDRIEEPVDVPVPHVVEIILDVHVPEVVKHIPKERVQNCTGEEIVDMPVPQIRKETWEIIPFFRQDEFPVMSLSKPSTFTSHTRLVLATS